MEHPKTTGHASRVAANGTSQRCFNVRFTPELNFKIVIGDEADDFISQNIAKGICPYTPLVDLMLKIAKPGQAVLDLGAHIGTFCLAAAAAGCRVAAVEASPRNVALLRASVANNSFDHLRVIHAAVAAQEGVLSFSPYGPYGHVSTPATNLPSIQVPAVTVDRLLADIGWPHVDFIKIDVEGSEIAALQGMGGVLSPADAPPICFEGNGHTLRFYDKSPSQLKAVVEELGYQNFLIEPGQLVPVTAGEIQPEVVADYLAVKRLPARLPGWKVVGPHTRQQLLDKVLTACAHPHEHHRRHIACVLKDAPAWLFGHRAVRRALAKLQADADDTVRQAAAWSAHSPIKLTWKDQLASLWRRSA
jgi:FkbM family methyltransferase